VGSEDKNLKEFTQTLWIEKKKYKRIHTDIVG
jgi:hypothetical protein